MPQVCQFRFGHCVPDSEFWPAQGWTCLKPTDIRWYADMFNAFSDARGWHSGQHLRKSVLFRRGMDLDLVQGHPKQTWIIEYVESPHQTAAFFCVWEAYLHAPNGDRKLTQKSRRTQKNCDPDFLEDSHTPGSLQGEGISSKLLPLIDFFHPEFHWNFPKQTWFTKQDDNLLNVYILML